MKVFILKLVSKLHLNDKTKMDMYSSFCDSIEPFQVPLLMYQLPPCLGVFTQAPKWSLNARQLSLNAMDHTTWIKLSNLFAKVVYDLFLELYKFVTSTTNSLNYILDKG